MRTFVLVVAICTSALLAGCQSSGDPAVGDIGSSFQGSLGRDTYGTNRRMDVYGGATAPSMPTFGARGYAR